MLNNNVGIDLPELIRLKQFIVLVAISPCTSVGIDLPELIRLKPANIVVFLLLVELLVGIDLPELIRLKHPTFLASCHYVNGRD